MERLTQELKKNEFYIIDQTIVKQDDNGYFGEAINKLGKFENLYHKLVTEMDEISKEMEKLRKEGKTNSVTFKHLMVKKLTNNNIISLFDIYGL